MSQPNAPTIKLHKSLIRLAKGALTAWEEWLKEKEKQTN